MLGKLPVPGRSTIWITVGQGPNALAVGAGGGCFDIFTLIYPFFPLSPSLWETALYRLKYCLKGPLNPKRPTNQLKENFQTSRLVCWFWAKQSFEAVFQSRDGERKELEDERKNVQITTPAPTASAVLRSLLFSQHNRTTRPPYTLAE